MTKKSLVFVGLLLLLFGFGCSKVKESSGVMDNTKFPAPEKLNISVSIYPIAHFVQKVGGEKVNVQLITPGNVEPHDYEPTPSDLIKIHSSKAFIFNGAGLDPWAKALQTDLTQKGITSLEIAHYLEEHLEAVQESGEGDDHGEMDPHIWLDPILGAQQVELIVQLLVALDPQNRNFYEQNGAEYIASLMQLDQNYKDELSKCALKEIVVSHDAFGYLGKRYGITIHPIAGISPEEEPSAGRLALLSHIMKEKNIKVVFFEILVSPKLAETLAKEAHADVLVLNPIEGITDKDRKEGKNYDSILNENLQNLKTAMVCQ